MKTGVLKLAAALWLCILIQCIHAVPAEDSKRELALLNDTNAEDKDLLVKKPVDVEWETSQPLIGGVAYTRWGSANCSSARGTTKVYSGMAGKAYFSHQGGGVDYQCMPENPQFYDNFLPGGQGYSRMYGVEYEAPLVGTQDHNMPCAVCYTRIRNVQLMIPARIDCPAADWTKEYSGYLMSSRNSHAGASTFVCVDYNQESLPGSSDNSNAGLVYHVEPICNLPGFPCPPYDAQKELACVVCTK